LREILKMTPETNRLAVAMFARFFGARALSGPQTITGIANTQAAFAAAAERWAPMFERAAREAEADAMLIAELDAKFSPCAGVACGACEQRNECGDRKLREVYSAWRTSEKEEKN
jgi:hypothetical protein